MKKVTGKTKSIKNRMFIAVSSLITVIIVTLIILNSLVLKSFYIFRTINGVKAAFNEINEVYMNQENVVDDLTKIALKNNFDILVENTNGVIDFSTNKVFADSIYKNRDFVDSKANKKFVYSNNNYAISIVSYNGLNCILLVGRINNNKTVFIQVPISAIEESVRISNSLLIIMGVITIVVSAIIASIISKIFTRPILKLNEIANKMANLDFSEKYDVDSSDDELNELGKSINTLSDKLEKTIKQLRSNNIQLEKDIENKSKIDEMRKQFISDVSHELKTPISLIHGYAEGLLENVNSSDEARRNYAEIILDESDRMDKLVKQLLELMKIEYGKMEFNDYEFDICKTIREVIKRCEVISKEKDVEIEFKTKDAINVYADEFYIEQVITNYVTNAIKHVKDIYGEKQITIKTRINNDKNKVRVSVYNTGDNISEENIEKIWGRFYKTDKSRKREDGGTGIGLALVKAIMTNYNLKYGINNKPHGVEFYFDIKLKGVESKS